jgi:hypothetical protein
VTFGDVNLQKNGVRDAFGTPQNPGAGGWPTIRYYNQATGYGGAAYEKLTNGAMCEELKDVQNMKNYVNFAGTTTSCDVVTAENCSEKEMKYIQKWKTQQDLPAGLKKELDRLTAMDVSSLQGDKKQWMGHRKGLLKALQAAVDKPAHAEL